jgi:hypothetical protein
MTAGETRKFHKNMEFERSARGLGLLALNLGAFLGPIGFIVLAVVCMFVLKHPHPHMIGMATMGGMTRRFDLARAERQARFGSIFGRSGLKYVAKRPNPNLGGVVQAYTDSLYDQYVLAAGAAFARTLLFQVGIGQGAGPKNLSNTNLTQSGGVLPNPYRFTVWGMGCHVSNNTIPADVQLLVANISATLLINNHPYHQGPLAKFPAGRGWQMVAATQTIQDSGAAQGTSVLSTSNGALQGPAFTFDIPITIEQGEQFQVILNPEVATTLTAAAGQNPAGAGTIITWYLDGNIEVGVS